MSQEWIDTLSWIYEEELAKAGFDRTPYIDFMARLKAREDHEASKWWTRWRFRFPEVQVFNFGKQIRSVYLHMIDSIKNGSLAMTIPWTGCGECPVLRVCDAMELGQDTEWVIENLYQKGATYHSFESQKQAPVPVGTIQEIIDTVLARTNGERSNDSWTSTSPPHAEAASVGGAV